MIQWRSAQSGWGTPDAQVRSGYGHGSGDLGR